MKALLTSLFSLVTFISISQPNTDIFLFDLNIQNEGFVLSNFKNISENEGYDNQPSFMDGNTILYSGSRNGQTDIIKYNLTYGSKTWICFTDGGEYSPVKIPNQNYVSAVRLDKDGKQRLYSYNLKNGEITEIIKDLVVAYYMWFNENTIVSSVIEGENLNLYVSNIKNGSHKKIQTKVGRSFHKIPNSDLISYISKENESNWQIKSLNPSTGETKIITNTMQGIEDLCWLNNNTILSGKDDTLFKLTLKKDTNWKEVLSLKSHGISNITRLATNLESSKLLIVGDIPAKSTSTETKETGSTNENNDKGDAEISEELASQIAQKHINPFNSRNLELFANAFDANVVVNKFPNDKMYSGRNTLKENYTQFFKENKKSSTIVLNRIVFKNMVIYEELLTVNNTTNRHVVIYETDNKDINSMTFLSNSKTTSNPEAVVNLQLEAYNKRDINAFVGTYASDVKLYMYPNTLNSEGQDALRKGYTSFFQAVPDLNAEIINRIVLGNKVIDKEKVTVNGKIFYAIAIYEVENEKISKVTFIQ